MAISKVAIDREGITYRTGNIYKSVNENSHQMMKNQQQEKDVNSVKGISEIARSLIEKRVKQDISMVEQFIEEHSGEYKRKAMWSFFSEILTYKKFSRIIDSLHESGKIAIDREGKIGWIWNPKAAKKYRSRDDLTFK